MSKTKSLPLRETADTTRRISAPPTTATPGPWQCPVYNALGQRVEDYQADSQGNPMTLTYPVDIFDQRTGTFAQWPSQNWTGWDVYWSQIAGQRLNMGGASAFIDHSDAVGSTTMETDPSGAVVWDVTHYPWGRVLQEQGTRQSEVAMGLDWQVNDPAIPSATREYNFRDYRWMTPDPGGLKVVKLDNPQTWNMYAYATNNPTSLNDPSGLWPWYVHDQKYESAFSGLLTPTQIKIIEDRSYRDDFDSGAQSPDNAFKHGMRSPGEDLNAASAQITAFIINNLQSARRISGAGTYVTKDALTAFADAEHALTDLGSPAHTDATGTPKVWTNSKWGFGPHFLEEWSPGTDWYGFGQSIRNAIAGFASAFPERLAPSSVDAVAQQRITDAVEHFFTPASFSAQGAMMMIEESARQCALGNPAACH